MAAADPLADIRLGLICPACGHAWQVLFDIVTFFWSEIDAWARRTLREVHALARAYGWREAEILALTARRRQHYLEILADERLPR
jgi:predicted DNA-binding transcriptional regulator AlpA